MRTDDLFNGCYDVVSCNRLQTKKALFYDPERDIKKLIWWNILYYNSHWSLRENVGKTTKGEFWRKLQDALMCDYLKEKCCVLSQQWHQ